ncbi:uncharacterized protein LOC128128875 [Lactuca sativa]|uniref:uncharacterized protein LOC128128875 n=1 Tax=Lactuca sativa TaxID=4236 RepID=UPI0022AF7ADF|nr:uncharacterized protein LOC128128875 [Lactuca sativa]
MYVVKSPVSNRACTLSIDLIDPKNEKSSSSSSGRIKLSDGRYLAYKERGVPKNESTYRVVIVHGFASNKEMNFMATQKLMDELGIYLEQFDRAGYGDSDPNPKRSFKSESSDIQELADQLQLDIFGVKLHKWGSEMTELPFT